MWSGYECCGAIRPDHRQMESENVTMSHSLGAVLGEVVPVP